jgi:hypothetical protein
MQKERQHQCMCCCCVSCSVAHLHRVSGCRSVRGAGLQQVHTPDWCVRLQGKHEQVQVAGVTPPRCLLQPCWSRSVGTAAERPAHVCDSALLSSCARHARLCARQARLGLQGCAQEHVVLSSRLVCALALSWRMCGSRERVCFCALCFFESLVLSLCLCLQCATHVQHALCW